MIEPPNPIPFHPYGYFINPFLHGIPIYPPAEHIWHPVPLLQTIPNCVKVNPSLLRSIADSIEQIQTPQSNILNLIGNLEGCLHLLHIYCFTKLLSLWVMNQPWCHMHLVGGHHMAS